MHARWSLCALVVSLLPAAAFGATTSCSDSLWVWHGTPAHSSRWSFLGEDHIVWSSSDEEAICDSLMLYWPEQSEITSEASLSFRLTSSGGNPPAFIQMGVLRTDTTAVLGLPYGHASPELPGEEEPNSFSAPLAVSLITPVDLTASRGIIIRVVAPEGTGSGSMFVFQGVGIRDGQRVTPLVPFPRAEVLPSDTVSSPSVVWHIPETPLTTWNLTSPPQRVASPTVALATTAVTVPGDDREIFRMAWDLSRDVARWEFDDARGGYPDPFILLRSVLYIGTKGVQMADSITVCFSLTMPGIPAVVSKPTLSTRSPCAEAGEVRISELGLSPSESEFVEIQSLVAWPLALGTYTLRIGDNDYSLPTDLVIAPLGHAQLTAASVEGLVLPNTGSNVRLLREESVIDSVSYGPMEPLPSAPYGWSLARKNGEWTLESVPSPGAPNGSFEPLPREIHGLVLSELSLWPGDGKQSFIEIANTGNHAVRLEGWVLMCEDVYRCPSDQVLDPSSVMVIQADQFPPYFLLNPDQGSVVLVQPNGVMADRCTWSMPPESGHALHRSGFSDSTERAWTASPPSPGTEPSLFAVSKCEIQVSRTDDGVVVQWSCAGGDSLEYHIYRASAQNADEIERISTFPIRGPTPYSFVDITAQAGESYLYWVAPDPYAEQADWSGPAHIPPAPADMVLILAPPKPNPFRNEVVISYGIQRLPEPLFSEILEEFPPGRRMKLGVYTVSGSLVRVLATDVLEEGSWSVIWDGRNENGQLCPPGVYVISLQMGPSVRSVKAVYTGNEMGSTAGGSLR